MKIMNGERNNSSTGSLSLIVAVVLALVFGAIVAILSIQKTYEKNIRSMTATATTAVVTASRQRGRPQSRQRDKPKSRLPKRTRARIKRRKNPQKAQQRLLQPPRKRKIRSQRLKSQKRPSPPHRPIEAADTFPVRLEHLQAAGEPQRELRQQQKSQPQPRDMIRTMPPTIMIPRTFTMIITMISSITMTRRIIITNTAMIDKQIRPPV